MFSLSTNTASALRVNPQFRVPYTWTLPSACSLMEQVTEGPIDFASTPLSKELLVHCYGERRVVLPRVAAYQVKQSIKALRLGSFTNVLACCRCREASFQYIRGNHV